jgi:hypothetical protein
MTNLRVTARLGAAPICQPYGGCQLDTLLAYAVVMRDGLPPRPEVLQPIEVPLGRDAQDRFYLCSVAQFKVETRQLGYTNRRFPVEEAQMFGNDKLKRINVAAGAQKSYRLPREEQYLVDDSLTWFCVGEAKSVSDLLAWIGYIGKRRGVGLGRVEKWVVDECDGWQGFPVLDKTGFPLRPIPQGYPGANPSSNIALVTIADPKRGIARWHHHLQEPALTPATSE